MKRGQFLIIKTDGTERLVNEKPNVQKCLVEMGYQNAGADSFGLGDGRMVIVNDEGIALRLPINPKATALYHSICQPGTTHSIRGNVAVVFDADFA